MAYNSMIKRVKELNIDVNNITNSIGNIKSAVPEGKSLAQAILDGDIGGGGNDVLIEFLQDTVTRLQISSLKMQFKYDIALNLVKNQCGDYFIDVLQDTSNIAEYLGCAYVNSTEYIE